MSFWREQMPTDMYLRSGPDWHLDTAGEHTFAAYFEDRGLSRAENDPVPIGVFLDHTDWFRAQKGFDVDERHVDSLEVRRGAPAPASSRRWRTARRSPPRRCWRRPASGTSPPSRRWHEGVPEHRRAHTCDLVDFDALAGARVVVVGGRQSAYEWAALLCDHGAGLGRRRAPAPRTGLRAGQLGVRRPLRRADPRAARLVARPAADEQRAIALEFWQVGRLTLEPWLTPRLTPDVVTVHASCEVVEVEEGDEATVLGLTDGSRLTADFVVFASGYRADIGRVPYLEPAARRPGRDRRVPAAQRGLRDVGAGPVHDRVRVDPRLRAVLRLHQGVPVVGVPRGRRDAALSGPGPRQAYAARLPTPDRVTGRDPSRPPTGPPVSARAPRSRRPASGRSPRARR